MIGAAQEQPLTSLRLVELRNVLSNVVEAAHADLLRLAEELPRLRDGERWVPLSSAGLVSGAGVRRSVCTVCTLDTHTPGVPLGSAAALRRRRSGSLLHRAALAGSASCCARWAPRGSVCSAHTSQCSGRTRQAPWPSAGACWRSLRTTLPPSGTRQTSWRTCMGSCRTAGSRRTTSPQRCTF